MKKTISEHSNTPVLNTKLPTLFNHHSPFLNHAFRDISTPCALQIDKITPFFTESSFQSSLFDIPNHYLLNMA